MATDTYDVIVIGGGPAGENAADYATRNSDRTAVIVEHELVGGECSYWACIPSKALLRPAHVLELARHVPGVAASDPNVKNVLARRDSFTSHRDDASQVQWANEQGIDVVRGTGRLAGPRTVTVDEATTLHARHAVVLATGTTANVPDVPGLRAARPWTSRDATNLEDVPGRIVIVGGGVVACEAATWLRAFGAEVTLLVRGRRLLTNTEPFAGERVAAALQERGVRVEFGADLQSVHRPEVADTGIGRVHGGPVTVAVSGEEIVADEILVAAGRAPADRPRPRIHRAGNRGYVEVDDHLTVPEFDWLYAVGDITHRAALTHMGKYQARVCGDVIAARAEGRDLTGSRFTASADHGAVPQVVFTDPEVAAVGRTEAAGPQRGLRRLDRGTRHRGFRIGAGPRRFPRPRRPRRRRGHRHPARGDVRRTRRRRVGPRGDDRRRRPRHARHAVARGSRLPHRQRDLAAPSGGASAANRLNTAMIAAWRRQ